MPPAAFEMSTRRVVEAPLVARHQRDPRAPFRETSRGRRARSRSTHPSRWRAYRSAPSWPDRATIEPLGTALRGVVNRSSPPRCTRVVHACVWHPSGPTVPRRRGGRERSGAMTTQSDVYELADEYVERFAALDPLAATGRGHHRPRPRDDRLLARRHRRARRARPCDVAHARRPRASRPTPTASPPARCENGSSSRSKSTMPASASATSGFSVARYRAFGWSST